MTRLKKWHLKLADTAPENQQSTDGDTRQNLVLVNSEGSMRKPNAQQPLGIVQSVSFDVYIV